MVVSGEPWDVLAATFRENRHLRSMEDLVKFIASSDYQYRIYGSVFLDNLVISGYAAFNLFAYCLHISFADGQFTCGWYGPNGLLWEEKIEEGNIQKGFPEMFSKISWY